jgi:hypothetical protein
MFRVVIVIRMKNADNIVYEFPTAVYIKTSSCYLLRSRFLLGLILDPK